MPEKLKEIILTEPYILLRNGVVSLFKLQILPKGTRLVQVSGDVSTYRIEIDTSILSECDNLLSLVNPNILVSTQNLIPLNEAKEIIKEREEANKLRRLNTSNRESA